MNEIKQLFLCRVCVWFKRANDTNSILVYMPFSEEEEAGISVGLNWETVLSFFLLTNCTKTGPDPQSNFPAFVPENPRKQKQNQCFLSKDAKLKSCEKFTKAKVAVLNVSKRVIRLKMIHLRICLTQTHTGTHRVQHWPAVEMWGSASTTGIWTCGGPGLPGRSTGTSAREPGSWSDRSGRLWADWHGQCHFINRPQCAFASVRTHTGLPPRIWPPPTSWRSWWHGGRRAGRSADGSSFSGWKTPKAHRENYWCLAVK